jgi:hypothetical protein
MFTFVRASRPVSKTRALFSALAAVTVAGLLSLGLAQPASASATPPTFNLTLDSSTSEPVDQAYVTIYHFSEDDEAWEYFASGQTGADGTLTSSVTGLVAGDEYAVQVEAGSSSAPSDYSGWMLGSGDSTVVTGDFNDSIDPDLDTWFVAASGEYDPTVHLSAGATLTGTIYAPNPENLDTPPLSTDADEIDIYRQTNDPVAGTTWEEYGEETLNVGTDSSYSIEGLSPGRYVVAADQTNQTTWAEQAFNFGSASLADATPVVVSNATDPYTQDVEFLDGGSISGHAVIDPGIDGDDGDEIRVEAYPLDSHGQADLSDPDPLQTNVDLATGDYTLALPAGGYDLDYYPINSASSNDHGTYYSQWYDNAPDPDTATPITITGVGDAETAADQTIGQGLTISGTVTATAAGNLEGIRVDALSEDGDEDISATTDASGFYTLTVPPEDYNLEFSDPSGFYPDRFLDGNNDGTQNEGSATVIAQAGGSLTEDFNYDAYSSLTVHVGNKAGTSLSSVDVSALSMTDGTPTPNAQALDATPVAGHSGTYLISGMQQNQSYALYFAPYGSSLSGTYGQFYGGSQYPEGSTLFTPNNSSNSLDVTLQSAAGVSGVVKSSSHHPIKGIEVDLYNFDGSTWNLVDYSDTSSSGAYSFPNVATGSYTVDFFTPNGSSYVSAFAGGAADAEDATSVYVAPGKPAVLNGTLVTGGSISGVVGGVGGTPKLPNIGITPVLLTGTPGDFTAATVSDSSFTTSGTGGKFSLTGLATGYYALSFQDFETGTYGDTYSDPVTNPSSTSPIYHVTAGKATVVPGVIDLPTLASVDTAHIVGSLDTSMAGPFGEPAGAVEFLDDQGNFVGEALIQTDGSFTDDLAPGDYSYLSYIYDADSQQHVFTEDSGTISAVAGDNDLTLAVVPAVPLEFTTPVSIVDDSVQTVGTQFTVDPGTWNHDGTTVSYQWLRDGNPIYGATHPTYTATGADMYHTLVARVTVVDEVADQFGPDDVEESISETATASNYIQQSDQLFNTSSPTTTADETGLIQPGQTIHGYPGDWNDVPGVTYSYQWLLDGSSFVEGTGPTFTPTPAQAGISVRLEVTAHKLGYADPAAADGSAGILIQDLSAPKLKVAPKVTSTKLSNGDILYKVTSGTWSVAGTPQYYWFETSSGNTSSMNSYEFNPAGNPDGLQLTVSDDPVGHDPGVDYIVVRKDSSPMSAGTPPGILDSLTGAVLPSYNSPVAVGSVLTAETSTLGYASDNTLATAFTFVWQRDTTSGWVTIKGATHQTYTVGLADVSDPLQVIISGSSSTHSAEPYTTPAGVGALNTALVDTPATVTGSPANTNDPLSKIAETVSAWGTTTGVTNSYQWWFCPMGDDCSDAAHLTNFTSITHATSTSYTPTVAQAQGTLVLQVTGTKSGYVTNKVQSDPVTVGDANVIESVTLPSITAGLSSGNAVYATKLTGKSGTFDLPGVSLSYQWQVSVDGSTWTPANGTNTGLTYTPTLADMTGGNVDIRLQETASKSGNTPATADSTAYPLVGAIPVPKVAPIVAKFGDDWIASSGTWPTQNGTTTLGGVATYEWFVNTVSQGAASSAGGANSFDSTSVSASDEVSVIVTDPGDQAYRSSAPYKILVQRGAAPTWVAPTISGTPTFGNTLSAPTDVTDAYTYPSGSAPAAVLSYQWYEGTKAISHATGSSYTPSSSYIGKSISVRITATSPYYATAVHTTAGVLLSAAPAAHGSPTLTFTGSVHPGSKVGIALDGYSVSGLTYGYKWQVSTDEATWVTISGATKSTYTVPTTYLGEYLRAVVSTSKTGYLPTSDNTADQSIVAPTVLAPIVNPTMTGTGAVGTTLTVSPGSWNVAGTTYTYQWFRDQIPIPGVTGTTYTPTGDELSSEITVAVTAHVAGYYSATATANSIQVSAGAAPTMITLPKISGTAEVGSTLSVTPGVWSLDGLTISYQWYEYDASSHAQSSLAGATDSSYTIVGVDVPDGYQLYCSVTASRAGYTSKTVTSALSGTVSS